MLGFLLRRLGQTILVFATFVTLVFFLIQSQPGDFTSFYALDPNIPPEDREAIRESFGLNKPVYQQYFIYLGNIAQGDFGKSFHLRRPVTEVIMERLPRTAILFLTATVISFYLGFVLGKMIAWRRGGFTEYVATISGVYLYTAFTPWFALMLIWLFAFKLNWFPIGKFVDPILWRTAEFDANYVFHRMLITLIVASILWLVSLVMIRRLRVPHGGWALIGFTALMFLVIYSIWSSTSLGTYGWDITNHMFLPVITLTAISFAGTMLLTRNSMLETLREDYVLTARAKGLPDKVIRDKHVARNAMLPVVTSLVFSLAFAIDGGVITETIFSWPGLGLTLLDSASNSDLPLAVGAFVFTGMFALVAHVVADMLHVYLDPRLRHR
ncbi:MAG: ABC transporter permease [Chloroflexi bacterium]|nr:ABC transporter permease [Chloroflexota bacterium]